MLVYLRSLIIACCAILRKNLFVLFAIFQLWPVDGRSSHTSQMSTSTIHSETDLLFRLPASLAGEALGHWLDLKALTALDSAFCNHRLRPSWLQLLQAEEFLFYEQIIRTNGSLWSWLSQKGLKATSFVFDYHSQGSEAADTYFRKFGHGVRQIRIDDALVVDVELISTYCAHLTHFSFSTTLADSHFTQILQRNPHLEIVHFGGLTDLEIEHFDGVTLPHLHTISLNNCPSCTDEIALKLVGMSSKLTKIGLYFCSAVTNKTIAKIAAMFPRLQILGLGGLQVDNTTINAVTKSCPHIYSLLLYGNRALSDAGLQKALQNLNNLRILDIQACEKLTELTMANLAKHSSSTLEVLYIGEKMSYSVSSAGSMLAACTQLRTFVWSAQKSLEFHESELVHAFTALRNIKSLLLGDGMSCDAALCLAAKHCTKLENINIYNDAPNEDETDFEEDAPVQLQYTAEGVFAVAQGCALLRRVVCKDEEVLNDLAKKFWKLQNPLIAFSDDDQLFCSSILTEPL